VRPELLELPYTQLNLSGVSPPSGWLSGRMSVGVQSDPTELAATQIAAWPRGPHQEWPLVWIIRLIDDSSERNFFENRKQKY